MSAETLEGTLHARHQMRRKERKLTPAWHPNPSQDPDLAVVAFDKLQAFLDRSVGHVLGEFRQSNNQAARMGYTALEDGVVGIAGTHPFVPRPLAMALSASDMIIHSGHTNVYKDTVDLRDRLVPKTAVDLVERIFEDHGFSQIPIVGYNHLAGTQHTLKDGRPDVEKNRIMAHLHRFIAGQLRDGSLAILFVDPEYSIPQKQKNLGVTVTRPSVTNLVGLNFIPGGEVKAMFSARYDTSTFTGEQLATQKASPLTQYVLSQLRPDLYSEPEIYERLGVNMEEMLLEKIDAREGSTEIVSKFTPHSVMARLAHGKSPGPEVGLQLSSTFLVLDGGLYLMINPDKNPKISWKPVEAN